MKIQIILLAALAALSTNIDAGAQASDPVHNPTPVEINRDIPRTPALSYPSEALALEQGRGTSRYFQPLPDWNRQNDAAGNTVFSTRYKVPFEWADRRWFLHVGGASSSYSVKVNGEEFAYNQSGRTAAEFDLTDVSEEGINTLEITVWKDPAAKILQSSTQEPALTGDVYITSQPRIRIRDWVSNALLDGESTALELGVIVKSHLLNPKTVRVYYALTNPDGSPGPYGHRDADFEMKLEDTVRFFVNIPDARTWSHEAPNLYTLSLKLQYEGRYTEYMSFPLGLRKAGMREGQLIVNGGVVPVNAAEYVFKGDITAAETQLREMKQRGVNTVILRGHPATEAFCVLCDRIGLYLCNTADIDTSSRGDSRAVNGNPSNDPLWRDSYIDRVMTMYHTTKNHPSVVMFSLGQNSSNGYNLYESYITLKSEEADRPVVYLDGAGEWNTDAMYAALQAKHPEALTQRIPIINDAVDFASSGVAVERMTFNDPDYETARRSLLNAHTGKNNPTAYSLFKVVNGQGTTSLHNVTVEWDLRQGKRSYGSGSQVLQGEIKAGEGRPILIDYGKAKQGTPVTVDFRIYRPRESFDPPAPQSRRGNRNDSRAGLVEIGNQTITIETHVGAGME